MMREPLSNPSLKTVVVGCQEYKHALIQTRAETTTLGLAVCQNEVVLSLTNTSGFYRLKTP